MASSSPLGGEGEGGGDAMKSNTYLRRRYFLLAVSAVVGLGFIQSSLTNTQNTAFSVSDLDERHRLSATDVGAFEAGSPILVMGLPQTMDRALANYFHCDGSLRIAQWKCLSPNRVSRDQKYCGEIIQSNIADGQRPLRGIGDFDVYATLEIVDPNRSAGCYFPQISALEKIHEAYPTATFILNYHTDVRDWIALLRQQNPQDVRSDSQPLLHERLVQCDIPPLKKSGQGVTDEELADFYWAHFRRIKEFVAEKGNTHKIVEVNVDSLSVGYTLEGAFGTPSQCWDKAVEKERNMKAQKMKKAPQDLPLLPDATNQVSSSLKSDGSKKSPVLVLGMPKAGTSSITEFFRCGGLEVSHWTCRTPMKEFKQSSDPGGRMEFCGEIIKDNIDRGLAPLENTGSYDVYAQMDVEFAWGRDLCFLPQLQALEELHHHYPDSPVVLNVRDVDRWISSVHRWTPKKHKDHRTMGERLVECDLPFLPKGKGKTDEELRDFYAKAYKYIADFVKATGRSHQLVIVDVQSPYAGHVLEDAFGIDKSCWGNYNSNPASR